MSYWFEKKKKDVKEGAGLYANIHAKRKRGGKMRKKGDKGAPSSQDFANAAKTAREELDLTQVAEAFGGQIIETKTFTEKSFAEFRHQLNEINERNPFSIDKILGAGLGSANFIRKQLQKIPSIKITDLADAIAPNVKKKIIGIRPGEKLHEEMITETDSMHTYEFKDYYIILNDFNFTGRDSKEISKIVNSKGGKKCKRGFSYNSKNNKNFLSIQEIRKYITNFK